MNPLLVSGEVVASLWLSMTLGISVIFFGQLLWNTQHYHLDTDQPKIQTKDLPTVSLCIPARNEDHALTECLQSALSSDYPKLEILVLDDCSQDTTSTIIRLFAHDGVRFLQGDAPAEGWLGKNQAMQTLAQQASGDYIIFASVDTHFGPRTITEIMKYTLAHHLQMVSLLPQNRLGISKATLFPTMNYFWRLVWPITRRHVPVSSRCWLIKSSSLRQLGGFASVSRKILPEGSFARRLFTQHSYHFVVGDNALGLTVAKRWSSQVQTSIRLLYPTAQRQPLAVLVLILAVAGLYILPILIMIAQLVMGLHGVILWLCVAIYALHTLNYLLVMVRSQPKSWLVATVLWPLVVMQEIGLLVASMLSYEFGEVNWKGRNVCYPVLGLPQAGVKPLAVDRLRG
jgi:chlorobactene glucosyltransferase